MHWLKKYTNKKCHAHSDMHLHNMATLFNNHPYVSSSGTPVGTKFTATYVGMVVEYCGHVMEVHITVCMALLICVLCQPVHSCIEPSLHGVDFFLEIFLWRLCECNWTVPKVNRVKPNCAASMVHLTVVVHLKVAVHFRHCSVEVWFT